MEALTTVMFHSRDRRSARSTRNRRPQPDQPRFARPVLEELEQRDLPSATGWEAVPHTDMTPLAGTNASAVYTPAVLWQAYGIHNMPYDGRGQTIAIVDAYDDPNIWADLQQFDRTFGIVNPPSFIKATPQGMPAANATWIGEIALDVEWAHAMAPRANILLVEAKSASSGDLLAAVDYARNYPGVSVVSMSWGGPEFFNESLYNPYFVTPANHLGGGGRAGGVTFVASSGDSGAWSGPEWPSVSPNVLAVGGTTLNYSSSGVFTESGWSGSGGGYSQYVTEPTYQNGMQHSGRRSNPDVAYNADPATGVYVFNSYAVPAGYAGWYSYGGTSAGAPQWAAIIALADQGRAQLGLGSLANAQATIYALPASDFHTINGGNNGYAATSGYNPVTGRGSPYADRVVQGLIAAGSSTLIVRTASGGSAAGGVVSPNGSGAIDALAGDEGTAFVVYFDTAPVVPATLRAANTLFATSNDDSSSPGFPALTRRDDLLRDVTRSFFSRRLHDSAAEEGQNVFDRALFGDTAETI